MLTRGLQQEGEQAKIMRTVDTKGLFVAVLSKRRPRQPRLQPRL